MKIRIAIPAPVPTDSARASASGEPVRRFTAARAGAAIMAFSLLGACATTSTATNRAADYSRHPDRIFIVDQLNGLNGFGHPFSEEFERRVTTGITACGGSVAFAIVSPLELDSSARQQQVARFNPDVIVTIRVTHRTIDQYGSVLNAEIDTQVWDVALRKVVWRGHSAMNAGGMFTPSSTRAESLYTELFGKMRTDGIVPSCGSGNTTTAAGRTQVQDQLSSNIK